MKIIEVDMSGPWRGYGLLVLGVLMLAGCDPGPKFVEVKGLVTLDGKPVEGATVAFAPITAGIASVGVTDSTGHFTLQSQTDHAGAVAGKYNVTVIKVEAVAGGPQAAEGGLLGFVPQGMQEKWLVPSRYATFDKSGLTVDIQPGMPEVELKLTTNP